MSGQIALQRTTLPALIDRASAHLSDARTSAEVLEARAEAMAILHYARILGAMNETKAECLRIIMYAEVRLADEINAAQARGEVAGPGIHASNVRTSDISPATFDDLKLDRRRVAEWRKILELGGERAIDEAISGILADGRDLTHSAVERAIKGLKFRVRFSGDFEWYTPEKYIIAVRECLGEIDLDPASSVQAQDIIRARKFFIEEDDGLKHEWFGRVWLNPPYSRSDIAQFVDKLLLEVDARRVTQAILLTNNHTDTRWFHSAMSKCDASCLTLGRIRFINVNGDVSSPPQGQAFFYYGNNVRRFMETIGKFGIGVVHYV